MLSMLSKITLSFDTNDLKNFLFFLPLATLSKNLELQSPSFINLTLDFCLKKTSSFSNTSSNSPFLNSSLPLVQEKNSLLVPSHPTLLCPKEYFSFFFSLVSTRHLGVFGDLLFLKSVYRIHCFHSLEVANSS